MGMFSYFTQDTHHRIVADEPFRVVMCDDKGNKYVEDCYEGYGVFGGKDYFELLAEMNGYVRDKCTIYDPAGNEIDTYKTEDYAKEDLRLIGISLAFDGEPHGMNPNVKHPSLTETGIYCNGEPPLPDPDQGFQLNDDDDDEYDYLNY